MKKTTFVARKAAPRFVDDNHVLVTKEFAKNARIFGTPEYKLWREIRADFPGMAEVVVSGRVQTSAKTNHRLTYENMEKYIKVYENADELMEVFKTVKTASVALASPYKYVCDWFKAQFPDYKKSVVLKDGELTIAPVEAPKVIEYKQKMPKAS